MKKSRNVVITGASRGIGRQIALDLANEETNFALIGTNKVALLNLAEELSIKKSKSSIYAFDLKNTEKIPLAINDFIKENKKINCLINNAGVFIEDNFLQGDMKVWDDALDVNIKASIHLTRACLPYMSKRDFVIFVNSIASRKSYAGGTNYCAAKFAQLGFANSLFEDIRNSGIKVCSILPGVVNTDMHEGDETLNKELMLQPIDVSAAVSYILSVPDNVCPTEIALMPQYNPKIIK